MPRYFLHYHDGANVYLDSDGCEFSDHERALNEARNTARDLLADGARRGMIDLTAWIAVEDEFRQEVGILRFSEAVEVKLDR